MYKRERKSKFISILLVVLMVLLQVIPVMASEAPEPVKTLEISGETSIVFDSIGDELVYTAVYKVDTMWQYLDDCVWSMENNDKIDIDTHTGTVTVQGDATTQTVKINVSSAKANMTASLDVLFTKATTKTINLKGVSSIPINYDMPVLEFYDLEYLLDDVPKILDSWVWSIEGGDGSVAVSTPMSSHKGEVQVETWATPGKVTLKVTGPAGSISKDIYIGQEPPTPEEVIDSVSIAGKSDVIVLKDTVVKYTLTALDKDSHSIEDVNFTLDVTPNDGNVIVENDGTVTFKSGVESGVYTLKATPEGLDSPAGTFDVNVTKDPYEGVTVIIEGAGFFSNYVTDKVQKHELKAKLMKNGEPIEIAGTEFTWEGFNLGDWMSCEVNPNDSSMCTLSLYYDNIVDNGYSMCGHVKVKGHEDIQGLGYMIVLKGKLEIYTMDKIENVKITKQTNDFEVSLPNVCIHNSNGEIINKDVEYTSTSFQPYGFFNISDGLIGIKSNIPVGIYPVTVSMINDPTVTVTFNIIIGEGEIAKQEYSILPQDDIVVIHQNMNFKVPIPDIVIVDSEGNPVDKAFEPKDCEIANYIVGDEDNNFIVSKDILPGTYILPVHMHDNDLVRQEFKIIILEETYTIEVADMEVVKENNDFIVKLPNVYVKDAKGEVVVKQLEFVADEALNPYILSFNEDGTVTASKDIPAENYKVTVKLSENESIYKEFTVTVKEQSNNDSDGSGGGSSSSSSNHDDDKDEPQTETKTEDGKKVAETKVSSDNIEKMLKAVREEQEENIVIKAAETGDKNITSLSVEGIKEVAKAKKGIEIESDVATIEIGKDSLDIEKIIDDYEMEVSKAQIKIAVDTVSEKEIKEITQNEDTKSLATIKIEIKAIDDQQEKAVTQLDKPITMKVKFDTNKVQNKEDVNLFVKGLDGEYSYVRKANIDMKTGEVEFNVSNLSINEYIVLEKHVTFMDIKDDPQREYIESVAAKGIVNGRGHKEFIPDGTLTRAEFATMAVKTLGLDIDPKDIESVPFKDVNEDHWASKYIAIAQKNGLIHGFGDGTFKPDQKVNKEQMIQMMVNTFEFENPIDEKTIIEKMSEFKDKNEVSSWAYDAVVKAKEVGLLKGVSENELAPKKDAKRSESTRVVYNLIKTLK